MRQLLMVIYLVLIVLTVGCASAVVNPCEVKISSHLAVTPVPQDPNTTGWWMTRHREIMEKIKKTNVDLIMLGDSITHRWEQSGKSVWDKYYANRNAINLGFGGDKTENVLWRLENGELEGLMPKLAILMIGTNNTNRRPDGKNYSAEEIADGIKAIVCKLHTKLPNTKVLILKTFPRGDRKQRTAKGQPAAYNPQWAKNDAACKLVSEIADNKWIFYLDINNKFLSQDGTLSREVAPDLVHLSEKGYQIWADAMEPAIVELMKE